MFKRKRNCIKRTFNGHKLIFPLTYKTVNSVNPQVIVDCKQHCTECLLSYFNKHDTTCYQNQLLFSKFFGIKIRRVK